MSAVECPEGIRKIAALTLAFEASDRAKGLRPAEGTVRAASIGRLRRWTEETGERFWAAAAAVLEQEGEGT